MSVFRRFLSMGLVMSFAPLAAAAAELLNPSFEAPEDPEEWTMDRAEHWGRWGSWINRETTWTPTRSGDCLLGYHHWKVEDEGSSGVYQDIAGLPPNREYTFNIYVYRDEGTNAECVELRIEALGGGDAIASQTYRMRDIAKGRWKLLTVSGTTTSEGLRVLIVAKPVATGKRGGALKFDDASLMGAE